MICIKFLMLVRLQVSVINKYPLFCTCRICTIAKSLWNSCWSCQNGSIFASLSSLLLSPPGDALLNICLCSHLDLYVTFTSHIFVSCMEAQVCHHNKYNRPDRFFFFFKKVDYNLLLNCYQLYVVLFI